MIDLCMLMLISSSCHDVIYRVAQLNWYQLMFWLLTFECPDVIRWFCWVQQQFTYTRCEA